MDWPGRAPTHLPALSSPQDSVYVFREGALPPYRQMFYQLCDLNVEEYVREGALRRQGEEGGARDQGVPKLFRSARLGGKPCPGRWAPRGSRVSLAAAGDHFQGLPGLRL